MRFASAALIASLVATAAVACYVGPIEKDETPTTDQGNTEPEPDTTDETTKATKETGLPCEIDELFQKRCRSCHGADAEKAPMALVTYDDLVAESPSDESKTNAELSLERMKSEDDPMPPGKATKSTSAEQKALAKWIADDYPRGSCGAKDDEEEETGTAKKPDAGKKADAGTTTSSAADAGSTTADAGSASNSLCTSGKTWPGGTGTQMNPGMSCFTCHSTKFQVAGTIYKTAHEPNKCYGESKISVVLTDSTGKKQTLTTNDTGNFTMRRSTATQLVPPFQVKIVNGANVREMVGSAPNGDCNGCHTKDGANGAPGRIMAP